MTIEHGNSASKKASDTGDRLLRWIGDLDHPFYDDERQRFVWYEASVIGFQLILMLQLVVAAMILLIMGADGLGYFFVAVIPTVWSALIVVAYARNRGADYFPQRSDFRRSRSIFGSALVVLCVAATVRLGLDVTDRGGFALGVPLGMGVGMLAAIAGGFYGAHQRRAAEDADDEI